MSIILQDNFTNPGINCKSDTVRDIFLLIRKNYRKSSFEDSSFACKFVHARYLLPIITMKLLLAPNVYI